MAEMLRTELQGCGLAVDAVRSLDEAMAALRLAPYALAVLDRRLPDGDGIELIGELRSRQANAAIMILSAMGENLDKVAGLDAGANDYLTKPFDFDEFRARVRAALRRPRQTETVAPIACGAIVFHIESREVFIGGNPIKLRRRELLLLEALMLRARRVVTREALVARVYGFDDEPASNTFEAHVSRLRSRLVRLNAGVVIHPLRGIGYILDEA